MRNARIRILVVLVMAGGVMGAAAQGAGPYYYNVGAEDYPLHAVFAPGDAPELVYVADLPTLWPLLSLSGAVFTDGAGHVEGLVYANYYFDRPSTISRSATSGGPYPQTNNYSAYTIKVTGKINTQGKEARVKLTLQGKGYDYAGFTSYPNANLSLKFTGNGPVVTVPAIPPSVSVDSTNYSVIYADGHTESFTNGPATKTNFSYSILSGTMKGNIKPGKNSPVNGGKTLKIDETGVLRSAGSEWRVEDGTNFVEGTFGGSLIVDTLTNIDAQVIQPVPGTKLLLNAYVGSRGDLFNGTGTANYDGAKWNATLSGLAFMRGSTLQTKGTLGPAIVAYELIPGTTNYAPRVVQNAIQQVTITSGKIFGQKIQEMQGASVPPRPPGP